MNKFKNLVSRGVLNPPQHQRESAPRSWLGFWIWGLLNKSLVFIAACSLFLMLWLLLVIAHGFGVL